MSGPSDWPSPKSVAETIWHHLVQRPFEWGTSVLDDAPEPNPYLVQAAMLILGIAGAFLGGSIFVALLATLVVAYTVVYGIASALERILSPVLSAE